MKISTKHAALENAKRIEKKRHRRGQLKPNVAIDRRHYLSHYRHHLADGTPITNKTSLVSGEGTRISAMRSAIKRGQRRLIGMELQDLKKSLHSTPFNEDSAFDADIVGKVRCNLINVTMYVTN